MKTFERGVEALVVSGEATEPCRPDDLEPQTVLLRSRDPVL